MSPEGKAQIRALMARLGAERVAARLGCSPHTLADALDGFLRPHIAERIERELARRGYREECGGPSYQVEGETVRRLGPEGTPVGRPIPYTPVDVAAPGGAMTRAELDAMADIRARAAEQGLMPPEAP